jgi:NAD(P)-dependent dehydrogenase (short-subunit alcohol dehydrogenase family)
MPRSETRVKKKSGKTVLITGGASGIGAAAAAAAARRGHRILITDIDAEGAQRVAAAIGDGAAGAALDVTSEAQWTKVLDHAWSLYGGLDVLINNAGLNYPGNSSSVPLEGHRRTLDVNFMGAVRGMLAALSRFKERGSGHLVTVCSMASFLPFPGLAMYAASKHALRAFHYALALEERGGPVKFTIVHPGSTETPMLEKEAANDDAALAFASPTVSAEFVGNMVVNAMEEELSEVFMPADRAKAVRRIGTTQRSLLKMVESRAKIGAENLAARRGGEDAQPA